MTIGTISVLPPVHFFCPGIYSKKFIKKVNTREDVSNRNNKKGGRGCKSVLKIVLRWV